ncbi:hypothetical protein [Allobaculum mucilyticum]|uniref:hypothetical protein n=1 Tax=Allobaculum mucilyticum TaxID=2834459 RepID=UPI001E60AB72|nr:hypothetical protein [Allobaculum mucilyticum]UNT95921.1 hypothetical protein KWG62_11630 [Allobaculum mucilyticum]
MIDRKQRRQLSRFEEVSSLLCKDLSWYVVYESLLKASEALHVPADADLPENKRRLYHLAASMELCSMLENHVFCGQKVEITRNFYDEAMTYFAMNVPGVPTYKLSGYLNYLESWSLAAGDWKKSRPCPFDSMEIAITR